MDNTKILPIKNTPVDLFCPHCSQPIYRVLRNKSLPIQADYWLRDGDMIPGLETALTPEQKTPNGFDNMLFIGNQPCCNKDYYVVECRLINANFNAFQDVTYYFEDYNVNHLEASNFQVNYQGNNKLVPPKWILTQFPSPKGIIHSHLFGPFKLTQKLEGRHGVAACGYLAELNTWTIARQMLVVVWDEIRALML